MLRIAKDILPVSLSVIDSSTLLVPSFSFLKEILEMLKTGVKVSAFMHSFVLYFSYFSMKTYICNLEYVDSTACPQHMFFFVEK